MSKSIQVALGLTAVISFILPPGQRQPALRLKAGDTVRVVITAPRASDAYSGDYLIQSDGSIYGAGFGRVVLKNHTVDQAQSMLRDKLKRLVNPQEVLLTLKSEAVRRVFIIGAPGGNPGSGTVDMTGDLGLRQALAGIVSAKDADLADVRVFRSGKEVVKINAAQLLSGKDVDDVPLQPDDVISISSIPMVRVWVTGSVRNPGPEQLPENASIDQAIAQAGGAVLPATADALAVRAEYRVVLRRGTTQTQFPLTTNLSALSVSVEPGDTILLEPPARNRVVVSGEVRNPGELTVKPGSSLASVLAQAGGVTSEGSASDALVYRNGEPIVVNADLNLDQQKGTQFVVEDGDTVVVRKSERVVYIFGQVQRQGRIPVPVGRSFRAGDALALAGGLSATGTLRRIYLARPGPDGRFVVTQFNLDEFIKDGKVASNPELKPGDVLLFGQARPTLLSSVTQVIGSLLFVNSISGAAGLQATIR